jgi:hypothetical protein
MRRVPRQPRLTKLSSISAWFSQLPCFVLLGPVGNLVAEGDWNDVLMKQIAAPGPIKQP